MSAPTQRLPDNYEPSAIQVFGGAVLVQRLALLDALSAVSRMISSAPMSPNAGRWRRLQRRLQHA